MWREKIIEAKKAKNISYQMIAEAINRTEQTIKRILASKTETPRIDTVLDMGAAVGLTPEELFSETTSVLGDKSFLELKDELNKIKYELETMQTQYTSLSVELTDEKMRNVSLQAEIDMLKIKLEFKDEIIAIHDRYQGKK